MKSVVAITQAWLQTTDRVGVRTYNLSKVANNHNFFANGVLVHNKLLLKELDNQLLKNDILEDGEEK